MGGLVTETDQSQLILCGVPIVSNDVMLGFRINMYPKTFPWVQATGASSGTVELSAGSGASTVVADGRVEDTVEDEIEEDEDDEDDEIRITSCAKEI